MKPRSELEEKLEKLPLRGRIITRILAGFLLSLILDLLFFIPFVSEKGTERFVVVMCAQFMSTMIICLAIVTLFDTWEKQHKKKGGENGKE